MRVGGAFVPRGGAGAAGVLLVRGRCPAAVLYGAVQNAVVMSLLLGSGGEAWLEVFFFCTPLKLALLAPGPAYAALGGLSRLQSGRGRRAAEGAAGV